ncbi:MAG: hypothetical protein JO065_06825 [Acidobacteria bacterium]|nr:hypothetical protein [Acidobacteriota bacterium]
MTDFAGICLKWSDMSGNAELDPQLLVRYLLGAASEEESARLDELSVTDEELAWRLRDAENDLLDAYARGDLSPDELRNFSAAYLASPARRHRAAFARALQNHQLGTAATEDPSRDTKRASSAKLSRTLVFRWLGSPAFAAVSMLLIAGATYLFVDNSRLRHQLQESERIQASLKAERARFETQLGTQQPHDIGSSLPSSKAVGALAVPSFFLRPSGRDAAGIPQLILPRGARNVRLSLKLEVNDFSRYQATLLDPAGLHQLWRSAPGPAKTEGRERVFTFTVPGTMFAPGRYVFELNGLSTQSSPEPVGTFPFAVVVK